MKVCREREKVNFTRTCTPNYDAPFYAQQLLSGYASRLKKGLAPADFQQLFAQQQAGLFDAPLSEINAVWRVVAD